MTRIRYFACGLPAVLAVALCAAGLGVPQGAQAVGPTCSLSSGCDSAHASRQSGPFARALFRLQNAERRRNGLRRLPPSRKLAGAARRHARDMIRRHYFGHVSPANRDVVDRVASTGYSRGRFAVQENLYWWRTRQSPKSVLRAWMASSAHRNNILNGAWSHFGLAAVMRSPFGAGGITVVGVFGKR